MMRKAQALRRAIWHAFELNSMMLVDKLKGRKTLAIHVGAGTQVMHIEPVLRELLGRESRSGISFYILTKSGEIEAVKRAIKGLEVRMPVHATEAARLLVLCDFMLTLDQGSFFPYFGCKIRACCFHGQPSKGNTYNGFNYRQINTLFFYGPLMRDYYRKTKRENPDWPDIDCHEVGQPLSDHRLNHRQDKPMARKRLGLEPLRFTVLYAPSFEYCSSLSTNGPEIIESLLGQGINLIVKPHPAFYNASKFRDEFNREIPNAAEWGDRVTRYNAHSNCVFSPDNSLDAAAALAAADAMITDFSGIAFDGILMDLGMIYWDCPLLFTEYLPNRYGIDGDTAKSDLACNVGRDAGIVVKDVSELAAAIEAYREKPAVMADDRERIRSRLLFNPGRASIAMAEKLEEIMGVAKT